MKKHKKLLTILCIAAVLVIAVFQARALFSIGGLPSSPDEERIYYVTAIRSGFPICAIYLFLAYLHSSVKALKYALIFLRRAVFSWL